MAIMSCSSVDGIFSQRSSDHIKTYKVIKVQASHHIILTIGILN